MLCIGRAGGGGSFELPKVTIYVDKLLRTYLYCRWLVIFLTGITTSDAIRNMNINIALT